jgi:hypothetical protein
MYQVMAAAETFSGLFFPASRKIATVHTSAGAIWGMLGNDEEGC